MKLLINHSNHPSLGWSDEQKAGYDNILTVGFPNIDPHNSLKDIICSVSTSLKRIKEIADSHPEYNVDVYVAGEPTYTFLMTDLLISEKNYGVVIATTERVSHEKDGVKTSKFKFVRWRRLN